MARKIIIGILLILFAPVVNNYYCDARYHISWSEMQDLPNISLKTALENPKYIVAIEELVGSTDVWSAMSKSQREDTVNKRNIPAWVLTLSFLASGILVLTIPVRKKVPKTKSEQITSSSAAQIEQDIVPAVQPEKENNTEKRE